MVREHSARLSLFLTMFFLAAGAFAQPQYEVVDLTELYGDRFTPEDINNNGVIGGHIGNRGGVVFFGRSNDPGGRVHPWKWSPPTYLEGDMLFVQKEVGGRLQPCKMAKYVRVVSAGF